MPDDKEKKFATDFLEKWSRAEREEGPADEALQQVDAALKEKPDDPDLWFRRASLLTNLERWKEALEAFRRVEVLDGKYPRLYVGLSFVLSRLGRTEEAAAAEKRALEAATGVARPEEEAELALEDLAEDLLIEEATAAAEERLFAEAPGPAAAPAIEDFPAQLAAWEAKGYDVSPLREIMEKDPDRVRSAFFQFEQNVRKVQVLQDTLDALDQEGLEPDIARMRDLFRSPYRIWHVEAEMAILMEKADERDRQRRTRVTTTPRARVTRATPPAAAGRVNGLGPGGRVNGQGGRVNGQTGRVNGQGRVNGLVNGVVRARSGLTNGLTNGLGFTNGLGSRRFAAEVRRRRGRIFLIPTVAILLLSVAFLLPETAPEKGGFPINGDFAHWERAGVPEYTQTSTAAIADVDLVAYRAFLKDGLLSVYAKVQGTIFRDQNGVDVAYAFVDTDGDRATGYDEGIVGAELLIEIQGGNGTVLSQQAWAFSGADRTDWNGWTQASLSIPVAAAGSELEFRIDTTALAGFRPDRASVLLALDDQQGSRSESANAFGPTYGALRVEQGSADDTVSGSTAPFLTLTLTAIGSSVHVQSVTAVAEPSGRTLSSFTPLTVAANSTQTVTLSIDAAGVAPQTLITAKVVSVTADRPVTIVGSGARAYVTSIPSGHVIDGLFEDWPANETSPDAPNDVTDPNVNIVRFDAATVSTTAYAYTKVLGTALGGGDPAWARARPQQGPASVPSPPGTPQRRAGEDILFVYYETGSGTGLPVGTILADAYVEVRGRHGDVRSATAFAWQGRWVGSGTAEAAAAGSEVEVSAEIPGVNFRNATATFVMRDWRGAEDTTGETGVRGTRSVPGGVEFTGFYGAFLPSTADGPVRFSAHREDLGLSWRLPKLWQANATERAPLGAALPAPIAVDGFSASYGGAYGALGIEVGYAAEPARLKETLVLSAAPPLAVGDDLLLETPIVRDPALLIQMTGAEGPDGFLVDGNLSFVDGYGLSIVLPPPWVQDAAGNRADLRWSWEGDALLARVPGGWLRAAAYPVVFDPTAYTLRNDGSLYKKGEEMGFSVAVGDFNADGYADVLTGAPFNSFGGTNLHGAAYIYYGPFTADHTTPSVSISGGTANTTRFGIAVTAGKFNNDNYWDALVARLSTAGGSGTVDIYYGSSSFDTNADVQFSAPSSPRNFGSVVAAGNIDNANYDDVLISEPGRDINGDATADGVVYLYESPFSTPVSTPSFTLYPAAPNGGQFGLALAVGKIDGDAYPDVVVGEPRYNNGSAAGRVSWFKGSDFTSGSGIKYPDATLGSQSSAEQFGASLSVGKLNGDAYADLVVGAPQKSSGNGGAYIFLANTDGSGLTNGASPSATLNSQSTGEQFGNAVLVLDWTDDGTPGVVVGAYQANGGGTKRGSVYWFNSPLTSSTPDQTWSGSEDNEAFGASLEGGKFASNPHSVLAIGAYLWDKNPANTTDQDGRVVVAQFPEAEPVALMGGAIVVALAAASLERRRQVRKR